MIYFYTTPPSPVNFNTSTTHDPSLTITHHPPPLISVFKAVLELQDVAGRDRFKDAAAIDKAVADIRLMQQVGWTKYREIQKHGLPMELPDEYDPDAKFVNTGKSYRHSE